LYRNNLYVKLKDTGIADDRERDSAMSHRVQLHNGGYIERVR
jgi:hypothetical protein